MLVTLGDEKFKKNFTKVSFFLKKCWNGKDFEQKLGKLFDKNRNNTFEDLFYLMDFIINKIKHECEIDMGTSL